MATISEEINTLKIRLGANRGADKITIVDHVRGTQVSMSLKEGYDHLIARRNSGQGGLIVHIVDHVVLQKEKLEPGKQTRFSIDCGTNEAYRELYAEWLRIFAEVKNKTMAIDFFTRGVRAVSKEVIDAWKADGHEEHKEPNF